MNKIQYPTPVRKHSPAPDLSAAEPSSVHTPAPSFTPFCIRRLEAVADRQCRACFHDHAQLSAAYQNHSECTQDHLTRIPARIPCPTCRAAMRFVPPAKSDQTNPLLIWMGHWSCPECGDALDVRLTREAMAGRSNPDSSGHDQSEINRGTQKEAQHRHETEHRRQRLERLVSPYQRRPY